MADYSQMRQQLEEMRAEREAWQREMQALKARRTQSQPLLVLKFRSWLSHLITKVRDTLLKE